MQLKIATEFFHGFVDAVGEEIARLQKSGILDREHASAEKGRGGALNRILYESSLRYLALRNFYETEDASRVRFQAECRSADGGPIDLILVEGDQEYAFEIKRWQKQEEKEILGKDYTNLTGFIRGFTSRHGYELISTINENKPQGSKFASDKRRLFEEEFENYFGQRLRQCDLAIREFETFTVRAYLATPKPLAQTADPR